MEQDNENRPVESAPPVENDLFTLNASPGGQSPSAEAEKPADPPAASVPETVSVSEAEPLREPEFKVNPEDRPPVRMLNTVPSAAPEEKPVSWREKPLNSLHSGPDATLGKMLAEARTLANHTIRSASAETRIRCDYIEALENDKPETLPNQVFLRAYVRALIQLYGLDAQSSKLIEEKLSDYEPVTEVPEKLIEDIGRGGQISEAETRRVKLMLIYGSVILFLLVSLVVTSVIGVSIRRRNAQRRAEQLRQTEQKFDTARLETLLPPQLPKTQMLTIPFGDEKKTAR